MLAERGQQSAQKNSAHWLTRLKIYLLWSSNITWVAPAAAVAGKSGNQLCRSRVRLLPSRVVCFPQPGEIAAPSSPKFETSGHTDTTTESLVVIRLAASSEFHLHHHPASFEPVTLRAVKCYHSFPPPGWSNFHHCTGGDNCLTPNWVESEGGVTFIKVKNSFLILQG